jgi:RNA polymerase sigma factor (sigma-70 family)
MPTAELQYGPPIALGARASAADAALVQRMRSGDEGSFEAIFKRHHAPLLSYCRHMLGNQDEAEDALQQAFIRAHKALLSGSPPRELRPWLYAIARNCCLSAISARRGWVGIESLDDRTPTIAGLSEEVHEREDLRELLADIGRLPEDQRSALLLAELDDLSHQEIAMVVGCPVSKVKALVYQARSALIADRDARDASCHDIREELSVARGGQLRRGPLRRHLSHCVGCRGFQEAVNAQRGSLAIVLPVLPSAGLMGCILGHGALHTAGAAGGGAAGGTGAVAGGGAGGITAAGGTAAGTTAAAGAVSSTSAGAVLGGGLLAKVAVGGAVAALATVGAVAIPHRLPAHTSQRAAQAAARSGTRSQGKSSSDTAAVPAGASAINSALVSAGQPAQAAGTSGPGAGEVGLSLGVGGPGSSTLSGLGGTSTGGLLAIAGSNPTQPVGGTGGLGQPEGKLAGAGHQPSGARTGKLLRHRRQMLRRKRLRKRHRLLRKRRRLEQRKHLKRVALAHPPAVVSPAPTPTKPARWKKTKTSPSVSTPSTVPATAGVGTTPRHKTAGHAPSQTSGTTTGASPSSASTTPETGKAGRRSSTPGGTSTSGPGKTGGSGSSHRGASGSGQAGESGMGSGTGSGSSGTEGSSGSGGNGRSSGGKNTGTGTGSPGTSSKKTSGKSTGGGVNSGGGKPSTTGNGDATGPLSEENIFDASPTTVQPLG